jgi:hypothetical protein
MTPQTEFTVRGAARELRCTSAWIRCLLADGRLQGSRKDQYGRWTIPSSALEPFLERRQARLALADEQVAEAI